MKKLLHLEFKTLFTRLEFKTILIITLLLAVSAFFVDCIVYFKTDISEVRSASEQWMGMSLYSRAIVAIMYLTLPLLASTPYSDTYYLNTKSGFNNMLLTRCNKKKYVISKALIVFASGFLIIFIPLLINQVLCLIAFPIFSIANHFSAPTYQLTYEKDLVFALINFYHPYLYNLLYMLIPGLFAGAFALLTYGISFLYKKSRLAIIGSTFIIYIIFTFLFSTMGLDSYSIYVNMLPGGGVVGLDVKILFALLVVLLVLAIAIISIASKKSEGIE